MGKGMELSENLSKFLRDYMRLKRMSYKDCSTAAGASWIAFFRIAKGKISYLRSSSEDALCRLFGVNHSTLLRIAESGGDVEQVLSLAAASSPPASVELSITELAGAVELWRWTARLPMRMRIARVQGYVGPLPAHYRDAEQNDVSTTPKEPQ